MRTARFGIVELTDDYVLIQDLGPWDQYLSVTNAAEDVVAKVFPILKGRRLEYIDSDGQRDQLLVKDGKFDGFAPIPK